MKTEKPKKQPFRWVIGKIKNIKGFVGLVQDEMLKVTQIGRSTLNQSFLYREQNKLFQKLGRLVYNAMTQNEFKFKEGSRLAEQIQRLDAKLETIKKEIKDLAWSLTHPLDAEHGKDETRRSKKKKHPSGT